MDETLNKHQADFIPTGFLTATGKVIITTEDEKMDKQIKICEYCEKNKAEGYVKSYDAHICEECYEDNFGCII